MFALSFLSSSVSSSRTWSAFDFLSALVKAFLSFSSFLSSASILQASPSLSSPSPFNFLSFLFFLFIFVSTSLPLLSDALSPWFLTLTCSSPSDLASSVSTLSIFNLCFLLCFLALFSIFSPSLKNVFFLSPSFSPTLSSISKASAARFASPLSTFRCLSFLFSIGPKTGTKQEKTLFRWYWIPVKVQSWKSFNGTWRFLFFSGSCFY